MGRRVLIIKTGHTETFGQEDASGAPSLGDVLRTTVILPLFQYDDVTWFTSPEAAGLLLRSTGIASLLTDPAKLKGPFDVVVNLEAEARFVELASSVGAQEIFGFTSMSSTLAALPGETWQRGLYRLLGHDWRGEGYSFRLPSTEVTADVGLNWAVGSKWPTKAWGESSWSELGEKLSSEHSVSWQKGFDSIDEYIDWIASCRTVITQDSLGLHLALAMGKKVVAIFGPTPSGAVEMYDRGRSISPDGVRFSCAPCWRASCPKDVTCMQALSVNEVFQAFSEITAC
ncbi:MAG: glycosyltransferase family 9 protein [Bdellovibrionota bacterium]